MGCCRWKGPVVRQHEVIARRQLSDLVRDLAEPGQSCHVELGRRGSGIGTLLASERDVDLAALVLRRQADDKGADHAEFLLRVLVPPEEGPGFVKKELVQLGLGANQP